MIESNIHAHFGLSSEDYPEHLFGGLVKWLQSNDYPKLAKLLHYCNPFSDNDKFDKLCRMLEISKIPTTKERYLRYKQLNPHTEIIVDLAVDMKYMGAGNTQRTYQFQIDEMLAIRNKDKNYYPFIMVDPRRPNILAIITTYVELYDFKGIKLYPNMGYFPHELLEIFAYAEKKNIPVMCHCNPDNPIHFIGDRSELKQLLKKSLKPIKVGIFESKKSMCRHFGALENYEPILKMFPKLRVCLAHLGGTYSTDKLLQMLRDYPNLYADISFRMHDKEQLQLLSKLMNMDVICDKLLYGDDWYMLCSVTDTIEFYQGVIEAIGKREYEMMMNNNLKFLGL